MAAYANGAAAYGVPGYELPDSETGPYLLQLNPGPEPSHDRLSGFAPTSCSGWLWTTGVVAKSSTT